MLGAKTIMFFFQNLWKSEVAGFLKWSTCAQLNSPLKRSIWSSQKRKNRVSLELNKIKYTLAPLTPPQVYEDQKRVKEAMKKFERENSEKRKGIHSDIPREEI